MTQSIIIVGPQGCGKNLNATRLCKAFKVTQWIDAEELEQGRTKLPKADHVIFANVRPNDTHGLRCITFEEAMRKVAKPHPMTPKRDH